MSFAKIDTSQWPELFSDNIHPDKVNTWLELREPLEQVKKDLDEAGGKEKLDKSKVRRRVLVYAGTKFVAQNYSEQIYDRQLLILNYLDSYF